MNAKRTLVALMNIAVFAGAGLLLYVLFSGGRSTVAPQDEDENRHTDAHVAVQVGVVARSTVHRMLTAYGQVEPAPASVNNQPAASVMVGLPAAERITDVAVAEGQHVDAGQILFRLDTRAADAQAAQAKAMTAAAQAAVDALAKAPAESVPAWAMAAAKWERDSAQALLARAQAEQQWRIVTAPISGTVTNLTVRAGQVADPSTAAVEIVDMNRLVAALDVPGFDAHALEPGERVTLDTSSSAGDSDPAHAASTRPALIEGLVQRVDPAADATTGMVSADITLPADCGLRPGQFVRGRIEIETHADCLVVPADAIVTDTGGKPRIALVEGRHRAYFKELTVGIREGDTVEVSAPGLSQGQEIVTGGAYALPPDGCNIDVER